MQDQSEDSGDLVEPAVSVEVNRQFEGVSLKLTQIESLVEFIAGEFGLGRICVSIAIADDEGICNINRRFLGRDSVTDVISWDLSEESDRQGKVFDLIVNGEKAIREAELRNHSAEAELALYIVHGILHNLGFDDLEPKQSRRMHAMENSILEHTGYGSIY